MKEMSSKRIRAENYKSLETHTDSSGMNTGHEKLSRVLVLVSLLIGLCRVTIAAEYTADVGANRVFYGYSEVAGYVEIIGLTDGTSFKIFDITRNDTAQIIKDGKVDRGTFVTVALSGGQFFKIIADKAVVAQQYMGPSVRRFGYSTFFPSEDATFVGKKFLFKAEPGSSERSKDAFYIFGFQDGIVTITNFSDTHSPKWTTSFPIAKESVFLINLTNDVIYTVTSTARICIEDQSGGGRIAAAPDITGAFVGKEHIGASGNAFQVFAFEPGTVKVYRVDNGLLAYEHTFNSAPGYWFVNTFPPGLNWSDPQVVAKYPGATTNGYVFFSTCDTYVILAQGQLAERVDDTSIGDDITFAGGRATSSGFEYVVATDGKVALIAPYDVTVTANGTRYDLIENRHRLLGPGVWHIVATKPIVVIQSYSFGPDDMGTYLMADPNFPDTEPKISGGNEMLYAAAGVIILLSAIGIFFFSRRRRV